MSLLQLPSEIRDEIYEHLEYDGINKLEDLKHLRLTCKVLLREATALLFRTVRVLPKDDSVYKWQNLAEDSHLNIYARNVIIDTFPIRNWRPVWNDRGRLDFRRTLHWDAALLDLRRFTRADSVLLRYSACCIDDSEQTLPECASDRTQHLNVVLDTIAAMNSDVQRKGPKVSKLTIANMQNRITGMLPSLAMVQEHLRELHVSVCTDLGLSDMIEDISHAYQFWPSFRQEWLFPVAESLTKLTLYCDDYCVSTRLSLPNGRSLTWCRGVLPSFDIRKLHFPSLKALRLGKYTFAYKWQIQWIAEHNSLQLLILDRCPVLDLMEIGMDLSAQHPNLIETAGLLEFESSAVNAVYGTTLQWDLLYDTFATTLPRLEVFASTSGPWDCRKAFDERYELGNAEHQALHVAFAMNTWYVGSTILDPTTPGMSSFIGRSSDDNDIYYKRFRAHIDEEAQERCDNEALMRLLEVTASRRLRT